MTNLPDKDPLYRELFEAVSYFWGRTQLVLRFIVEQGVDPASMRGVSSWTDKTPQTGMWGTDWRFFFHGAGCTLTHVATEEPIDWEGPDPLAFSPKSFTYHLDWRLKTQPGLTLLRKFAADNTEMSIWKLIDDLVADGIIGSDYHLSPVAISTSES